jgi:hypothetical protein
MTQKASGLAHSVQARLARRAKELRVDPNLLLVRFATERLLYRLSRSEYANRFVLKGGLLLLVWLGENIRPTRDADLLGIGELSEKMLRKVFADVCGESVEPDGVEFEAASVEVSAIRPEDDYGGQRITLRGKLGAAKLRVQVDVGFRGRGLSGTRLDGLPQLA